MIKKLILLVTNISLFNFSMCNTNTNSVTETMTSTMISNMSLTSVLTVGAAIGITYLSYKLYKIFMNSGTSSVGPQTVIPNSIPDQELNTPQDSLVNEATGVIEGINTTNNNVILPPIDSIPIDSIPIDPILIPSIPSIPIDPMLQDHILFGGPFGLMRHYQQFNHNIPLYQGYRLQQLRDVGDLFREIDLTHLNVSGVSNLNFRCHNILTSMLPHLNLNAPYLTPDSYKNMLMNLREVQIQVEVSQDIIIIKSVTGDKSLLKYFNDLHYYGIDITNLTHRIIKIVDIIIAAGGSGFF